MKFIGKGKTRVVFDCGNYVLKICISEGGKQNIQEKRVWDEKPEWRKWLCEPYKLYFNGIVMKQEKGDPIDKMPKKYPKQFIRWDNKAANWVKVGNQYKRCDYHQFAGFL